MATERGEQMPFHHKITQTIKGGVTQLQDAHKRRVKAADAKARKKMRMAKTALQREKARTDLAREKVSLERELYESKLALQQEKKAATQARQAAGVLTVGERLGKMGKSFGRDASSAFRALTKPSSLHRSVGRTARRSTAGQPKQESLDDLFYNPLQSGSGRHTRRR